MRHLRVPKRATQEVLEEIRRHPWAPTGLRVLSEENDNLVPLGGAAPESLPPPLNGFEMVMAEQPTPPPRIWSDHLPKFLDAQTIEEYRGLWPNSQEPMGDILIFKIDHSMAEYSQQVALAKLTHHKRVRAVFRDHGVEGEFRIRRLEPLAVRDGDEILDAKGIAHLEGENRNRLLSTLTTVQEFGVGITTDPSQAYYSHRLQGERERTVQTARRLSDMLGRPVDVADPFCGVGPAFSHLLSVDELVGGFLATDLNPQAIPLLAENLARSGIDTEGVSGDGITTLSVQRWAGLADAVKLADDERFIHRFDLLLVNIPHQTLDTLPLLLPLLRLDSPVVIRGWLLASDSDLPKAQRRLVQTLPHTLADHPEVEIERRRQYSATEWLCRFEAWLRLPE